MLIFPKAFNVPSLFSNGLFLDHWLFMHATMPLGLASGWGQRSMSRMMIVKVLVKILDVNTVELQWVER